MAEKKTGRKNGQKEATAAAAQANAIFPDAQEFAEAANGYFRECDEQGVLYSEAGLCVYLSEHNRAGRVVKLRALHDWYDGRTCEHLQDQAHLAYLKIQRQVESHPAYREKGMVPRSIFLNKQARLGGLRDQMETKNDATVRLVFGSSMDASDLR